MDTMPVRRMHSRAIQCKKASRPSGSIQNVWLVNAPRVPGKIFLDKHCKSWLVIKTNMGKFYKA